MATSINSQLARQIRLLHLVDGLAGSEIARRLSLSTSCINKVLCFVTWANQDQDLQALPRPVHKGGGSSPGSYTKPRRTCFECRHFLENHRRCDLDFPECRRSNFREACHCNCFQPHNQSDQPWPT